MGEGRPFHPTIISFAISFLQKYSRKERIAKEH